MALQLASKRLLTRHIPATVARTFTSASYPIASAASETVSSSGAAPTVFDKVISLTIVDPSGARRKIPGLIGKYLLVLVKKWRPVVSIGFGGNTS